MGGQHTTVGTTRRVAVLDRGVAAQRILTALTSLNATDPSQRWVTVLVTNDPPDTEPWYARDADDILHLSHSAASPQTPTATASIATALRAADIDHAWIAPSPSVDPAALATALRDVGIGTLGADIPSWRQWHTPPNPLTDEHRPGRTVELLVLRDTTGQCHVLGPAEISHDGRHRPILVALPPHGLTATDIATIQDAARHCAHHGNLVGALTVHFRQDLTGWTITATEPAGHSRNAFWDHVTGHDLIALAASITTGGDLPATLEITTGHTLQARLLTDACDADHHLTSSTVAMVAPPHGVGVHTDLILREGDHVNPHLDPDIATVTAHGSDPTQTRHRVRAALEQLTVVLTTCTTNRTDLIQRLDSTAPEAAHDQQHTTSETDPLAVVIAAVEAYEQDLTEARLAFRASAARGRPHPFTQQGVDLTLTYQDRHHQVHVSRVAAATYQVRGRRTTTVDVHRKNPYQRRITLNGQRHRAVLSPLPDRLHLEIDGTAHDVIRLDEIAVRAPAPALICAITATPGQYVDKGSPIAVVESMKMTTTITAPLAGTILSVPVLPHEQVAPGTPLVRIRATPTITPPAADSPDPTTPSADGPPRDLFTRMRDHLLGYDQDRLGPATWEDDYRQLTTADPTSNELHTAEDALLDLFADLGSLYRPRTETRTSDPDDTTAFSNTQEYFLTYLIWLDADRAGLPLRYRARLERALNRYGIHTTSDPAALDEATFWLHRSFSRVPAMVPLVIHILQRRLDTARTHPEHITQVFKGRLERLIRATRGRQPAVTDLARDILFHLYDEPLLTRTPHEPPTHRPADHLDLWRLENFTLTPLPAPDDIHLFDAIAHDNPQDRRLFAIAEIHHLTPHTDPLTGHTSYPHLGSTGLRALAAMRTALSTYPTRQRPRANRLTLLVRAPWTVPTHEWTALAATYQDLAHGAGLEKVVLHVQIPEPGDDDNTVLRDQVLTVDGLGVGALTVRRGEPPRHPVQTLTPYAQKVLTAARFGSPYPYEIIRMLTPGPDDRSPFPTGHFQEFDLTDDDQLSPVDREPGGNQAHLVVGVLTHVTATHPEGMSRVALLSDPTQGLGNLAEPECRRVNAALDYARAHRLPVEWYAVSSGALIAMDSGTENMDWISLTLRRIIEFTQDGGEINIIVTGINVGGQPYWNAEATMLMHTKGILVMTPTSTMVLTGKQALDFSGAVSAEDNHGIGGYDRIMGPNGQAQYWAPNFPEACSILLRHYDHTYVMPGETFPRRRTTSDPWHRDVCAAPHLPVPGSTFTRVGDIFDADRNGERKLPFDMRSVMRAVCDTDGDPLERWQDWQDADTVITWDARIGGIPVCLLGLESHSVPRRGFVPSYGPPAWTSGTLFPQSSRKCARSINAASGNRPLVVLANLSGFDGSPESMRNWQLEYGAEIGRAVTNFRGPIVFVVVSRYHGGAFVVFSKQLNASMEIAAIEGSYASVIGGAPAAATVFVREVAARTSQDARVVEARQVAASAPTATAGTARQAAERIMEEVRSQRRKDVADEFDGVHTVERAQRVGSVDLIIPAAQLRPYLVDALERGMTTYQRESRPRG